MVRTFELTRVDFSSTGEDMTKLSDDKDLTWGLSTRDLFNRR